MEGKTAIKKAGRNSRFLCLLLVIIGLCTALSGCSKKEDQLLNASEVETNTILVGSDGAVQSAIVEDFDKEYYNQEELEQFIRIRLKKYNASMGADSVAMDSLEVVDGKVRVVFNYKDMGAYSNFNKVDAGLYTMEEAINEHILPDTLTEAKKSKEVAAGDVEKNKKLKVAVIYEPVDVAVNGSIAYYNGGALLNNSTIQATGDGAAVIVYK